MFTNGWGSSFYVNWDQKPSTSYEIRLAPGMKDPYGNETKEARTIKFTTRAYDPDIWLQVPGGNAGTYNAFVRRFFAVAARTTMKVPSALRSTSAHLN